MGRAAGSPPRWIRPALRNWVSIAVVISLLSFSPCEAGGQTSRPKTAEKGGSGTTKGKKKGKETAKKGKAKPTQVGKEKKGAGAAKTPSKEGKQEKDGPDVRKAPKELTGKAEPVKPEEDELAGKMSNGRPVYAGSRGGHYYVSEGGEKVYVNEFEGAKIVGTTAGGRTVYEGLRGGHYYYNDNGNKVYVPTERR